MPARAACPSRECQLCPVPLADSARPFEIDADDPELPCWRCRQSVATVRLIDDGPGYVVPDSPQTPSAQLSAASEPPSGIDPSMPAVLAALRSVDRVVPVVGLPELKAVLTCVMVLLDRDTWSRLGVEEGDAL